MTSILLSEESLTSHLNEYEMFGGYKGSLIAHLQERGLIDPDTTAKIIRVVVTDTASGFYADPGTSAYDIDELPAEAFITVKGEAARDTLALCIECKNGQYLIFYVNDNEVPYFLSADKDGSQTTTTYAYRMTNTQAKDEYIPVDFGDLLVENPAQLTWDQLTLLTGRPAEPQE